MNIFQLRNDAKEQYQNLVKGTAFLVLLISSTVSVVLSIMGNGIQGIITQLFPLIILIGLYIARSFNRTGARMVQVCTAILFWMNCIICSVLLITVFIVVIGPMSQTNSIEAVAGALAGVIIAGTLILLQFFFSILYNRNIQLIMKDVVGWFVHVDEDESQGFPPESRHRVSCRLVLVCIVQLVLNGAMAVYLLSMFTRSSLFANIGGSLLNGITGDNAGSQVMRFLIPSPNIFAILAQAATIAKLISVIILYKQYQQIKFLPAPKTEPQPTVPVTNPDSMPAPKKRSVRIILDRKPPKEGRFSACMTSEMVVGRREGDATLVIRDDPAISGHHMRLIIRDNKLYAEDLGSHNGLYINGQRVQQRTQIHREDEIHMGNSTFILTWET